MKKEYVLSKIILKRLAHGAKFEEVKPRSRMEWFAAAKFYRELLYLSRNAKHIFLFGRYAILSFLNASMPYAAIRIFSHITRRLLLLGYSPKNLEELIELFAGEIRDAARIVYLRELFMYDPQRNTRLLGVLISKGLISVEDKILAREIVRVLLRSGLRDLCLDFIAKMRSIDPNFYPRLLGIALAFLGDDEAHRHLNALLEKDLNMFLAALWEYVNEAKDIPRFIFSILSDVLHKIKSGREADILSRILAVIIKKTKIPSSIADLEYIISRLYSFGAKDGLVELSLIYAKNLLRYNPSRSLIFLDLAINLCYENNDPNSVPEVIGDYLFTAFQLGLFSWLKKVAELLYSENKVTGVQHLKIWQRLIENIPDEHAGEKILEIVNAISSLVGDPKHRVGVQKLICLNICSERDVHKTLDSILDLKDSLYIILAIKYLTRRGLIDKINLILKRLTEIHLPTKDLSEILFAVALKATQHDQRELLLRVLDTAKKILLIRNEQAYASLLMEIANRVIDRDERLGIKLLDEAARFFEKSGMYWMGINALAIISAHNAYNTLNIALM